MSDLYKSLIIKITKQTQHAEAIENTINTETMMSIAKRRVYNTNDKLNHLKLCHCLLPLWPLGGVQCRLAIVKIKKYMYKGVHP